MVKLKYSEISSFQFQQAVQKIAATPTHGQKASLIHKTTKAVGQARTQISKEFQDELVPEFAKKDAEGKIIRPEGEPNGFEPDETREAEFLKAQEAFGERWIELPKISPYTLDTLSDIKVSAQDLEALKGLYTGNLEDEGKPSLSAVK